METLTRVFGPMLLNQITPSLRGVLETFVQGTLYAKAKETPNPWDNMLVAGLAALLGMELKG